MIGSRFNSFLTELVLNMPSDRDLQNCKWDLSLLGIGSALQDMKDLKDMKTSKCYKLYCLFLLSCCCSTFCSILTSVWLPWMSVHVRCVINTESDPLPTRFIWAWFTMYPESTAILTGVCVCQWGIAIWCKARKMFLACVSCRCLQSLT